MKKIYLSIAALVLIFACCFYASTKVDKICEAIATELRAAETECILGRYAQAAERVQQAESLWVKNEGFLGVALRHTETDDISVAFPALTEALFLEDDTGFLENNLTLIASLRNLSRMEQPYLFNIL